MPTMGTIYTKRHLEYLKTTYPALATQCGNILSSMAFIREPEGKGELSGYEVIELNCIEQKIKSGTK